jgi:hypothetical protein
MHVLCFAPEASFMNGLWVAVAFVVLVFLLVSRMVREQRERQAFDDVLVAKEHSEGQPITSSR